MATFRNIEVSVDGPYARVILNRPKVRNAFDGVLLEELADAFGAFAAGGPARVVTLSGAGDVFCAGADLAWMKGPEGAGRAHFLESSAVLARALRAVDRCPLPVLALVHKAAVGGALGLLAAADFVLAEEGSTFRASEVRLGLAPAVVGPYLLRRLGDRACRELFLVAEPWQADRAMELGLVQRVVAKGTLEEEGEAFARPLLEAGPKALAAVKEMLRRLPSLGADIVGEYTERLIADLREGAEGQEGMAAFLGKRKPRWNA